MTLSDFITTQNITLMLLIGTIAFSIWSKIAKPQQKGATTDALIEQKATILDSQYEKKFSEIQQQFVDMTLLHQNHIHALEVKIDSMITGSNLVAIQVAKLEAIIDERIPAKKVAP